MVHTREKNTLSSDTTPLRRYHVQVEISIDAESEEGSNDGHDSPFNDDDYYANDQEYIEGYEETDYRAEEYYYDEDEPPRQPKLDQRLPSPKQR